MSAGGDMEGEGGTLELHGKCSLSRTIATDDPLLGIMQNPRQNNSARTAGECPSGKKG